MSSCATSAAHDRMNARPHDREPEEQSLDTVGQMRLRPAEPEGRYRCKQGETEDESNRSGARGRPAAGSSSLVATLAALRACLIHMDWVLLVVSLLVILAGAELFTNGVEWVGEGFGLSEGAVGWVLAAVGTALPETILPIIAILRGTRPARRSASARSSARRSC